MYNKILKALQSRLIFSMFLLHIFSVTCQFSGFAKKFETDVVPQ